MNSHRDNVKDAVFDILDASNISETKADVLKYEVADAVFLALGITEDEQDTVGGYFMLHAGDRCVGETFSLPKYSKEEARRTAQVDRGHGCDGCQ